ncbi:MAG: pimeloyl-ACP methyl ester esterase BioH [Rudaea sp.]|uniref:pimeloyl-ACP methyl ester esterase BioH n=1 Tax=Rudaea sp. TaxID=2136325 RepID=UPI0039E3B467
MHIETVGAGPELVLIHGWAMHGGIFAPLTPLLAERFRVHVVDLPGHGFSRGDESVCDLATWAARVLDATPPAIWVGWSLGGLVALQAALTRPSQVHGLVETAASPRFVNVDGWTHGVDLAVFTQFALGLRQNYREAIERFLALETLGSANAQAELRELKALVFARSEPDIEILEHGLDVLETADLRIRLAQLAMPSLWIAGRRDRLVPPAAMRWASAQSMQSGFVEIASGHAPFLSHAREVADAIFDFAARLPAP